MMPQRSSVRFIGEGRPAPLPSLYERVGGRALVDSAVDIFYAKVLADDRINMFFENIDMVSQQNKQKRFLTMVFGGPSEYSGKDMHHAHARMRINEAHFSAMLECLTRTLKELNVFQNDINEILEMANCVKNDVLNR